MLLTDTHAHLDDEAFDEDRDMLIDELSKKVKWIINNSCDAKTLFTSYELACKYPFIYATAGIHPHDAKYYDDKTEADIRSLITKDKVVAVGEIGLDYYYDYSPRDVQKEVFVRQMDLAKEYNKPITVHSRDAANDTYQVIKEHLSCERGAVLHSFSQSVEMLKQYLDLNVYFSVSGAVTFKNADKLREAVSKIPLERMFIETDSPYLTPVPFRGKRNTPDKTEYTAKVCAELKGVSYEEFLETVNYNAEKFFGIDTAKAEEAITDYAAESILREYKTAFEELAK